MKKHSRSALAVIVCAVCVCVLPHSGLCGTGPEAVQKPILLPQQQVNPQPVIPLPKQSTLPTQKQAPGGASTQGPVGPAFALPDLQVNRIFISKPYLVTPLTTSPMIGDKIDICCEYANAGKDIPGSPSPWSLSIGVDGIPIATRNAYGMPTGSTQMWCQPYTCNKEGSHRAECMLDTTSKVSEGNETNNKKAVNLNVATTDLPMAPGAGVNLRITDLSINNNDGRVIATVRNFGPSAMSFDAKVRLRRDNVLIKECLWQKNISPMVCSTNMLLSTTESGPEASICNWGKGDYDIHAEIITEWGQPEVDKSGKAKRGTLKARQDLFAGNFYEDSNGNVGIIIGNKGPCYATPWSYKFYIDGNLKETGPVVGGLMRRNESAHVLLKNQTFFTQSVKRQGLFRVDVLPQYPDHEQTAANNSYQVKGLSTTPWGIDLAVTDMIFLGQYYQETNPNAPDMAENNNYFRVLPYIKNIGTVQIGEGAIVKIEFFIDNVSMGERVCHPSLAPGEQMAVSYCFISDTALPLLPVGSHNVRFVITMMDANILNNHIVKTMVRP